MKAAEVRKLSATELSEKLPRQQPGDQGAPLSAGSGPGPAALPPSGYGGIGCILWDITVIHPLPPFPPRRSPDTLPSHGSPLCRLIVEGDWVCVWTVSVQFAELLRLACRDYKIWLVFVTEWLIIISCRIDMFRYRYRPAGRAVCLFF